MENERQEAGLPTPYSPQHRTPTSLSERLVPVSAAVGNQQLSACLVLVAPSGMTADEREQWLKAARLTLKGIPQDLLERGCARARERARFPSEIVPTIMDTVGKSWAARKAAAKPKPANDEQFEADPWVKNAMAKLVGKFKA